ncbi:MAG: type II toxin-antitoxin system VapB family antitoxin [Burkholderiales bacterium]|nr:type II toxin-antitoxin system VapB family antitoxin [Pseudomonadota bacterium]
MRTNIDIDDKLLREVMKKFGFETKREAVHEGLAALKRRAAYARLLELGGKLQWDGDLNQMRLDKSGPRK